MLRARSEPFPAKVVFTLHVPALFTLKDAEYEQPATAFLSNGCRTTLAEPFAARMVSLPEQVAESPMNPLSFPAALNRYGAEPSRLGFSASVRPGRTFVGTRAPATTGPKPPGVSLSPITAVFP